jgi:hypothetical protein
VKFNILIQELGDIMRAPGLTVEKRGPGPGHLGQLYYGPTAREVLQHMNVPPDFESTGVSADGTIDWIHRKTDDADIYYVASRWEHPEKIQATFRVAGRQPELWDPVTGETRDAMAFHQENGRTTIPLEFNGYGSTFVIFRKPISSEVSGNAASNYPATHTVQTLSGPWTVNFDPKWGGPKETTFDQLIDWTNSPEPGIKYYSGTAIYHKEFTLPDSLANGSRLLLDLGEVDALASVRLNGRDLGVVWTRPARIDISGAVKQGENKLEVTVVNLWPNRMGYDESLPKEQRLTESNIHKFSPASPLLPSGLVGPVSVLAEDPLPQ